MLIPFPSSTGYTCVLEALKKTRGNPHKGITYSLSIEVGISQEGSSRASEGEHRQRDRDGHIDSHLESNKHMIIIVKTTKGNIYYKHAVKKYVIFYTFLKEFSVIAKHVKNK